MDDDLSSQAPEHAPQAQSARGIVTGQHVDPVKVARSRALRRTMTEAEQQLWQHLRGSRLGGLRFRRQQIIGGFIVDFYCQQARLVIEVDGNVHADQREYDAARDQAIAAYGLRVLRLANRDVLDCIDAVLRQIAEACAVR